MSEADLTSPSPEPPQPPEQPESPDASATPAVPPSAPDEALTAGEPETPDAAAAPIGWKQVDPVGVEIEVDYDPHVNYAMQQNAVPVVKAVRVRNVGETPLTGVTLALWAAPELAPRVELVAAEIPAGAAHRFETIDLPFSATRLVNKDEREQAQLWVEVVSDEDVLFRRPQPLEVLAYSEWAGARSLPEILAAFVLPNHPGVERLLAKARDHLERATGDPTLDGYRANDPARVKAVVHAVYTATRQLDLTYVSPPASFEQGGQKIRMPERMLETSFATCLDLVCFTAAALEQAGLHPLLVLLEDHAMLGVWMTDESFAHATVDEVLRLRKRVQIDTLLMIETTGLTARPPLDFDEACEAGARQLEDATRFAYAVDVRAARRERIRPLPGRIGDARYAPVSDAEGTPTTTAEPVEAPRVTPEAPPEEAPDPSLLLVGAARLDRWKRKLLDLTLRNRLLNFKPTRSSLPLLCPDVHQLEDLLAAGRSFRVEPQPKLMGAEDPRDAALEIERTGVDPQVAYLVEEMGEGRLHADLDEELLDKRIVFIDRAARTSLEEGGANTLYLAIGFLHWFETKTSETERMAPVLLLPLLLTRAGVREGYRLELADEDPQVNVTLLQKLAADYDVPIDGLEELESDDSGIDVARLLRKLREAVLPLERWEVREEAVIGLFSFTKHLMWRDLDRRAGELMQNAVVRHLVEQPGEPIASDAVFPDARTLDANMDPADTFCPLDADSSQLRAVHAAAAKHTFVLEGPPGTGKSQTIANLVAHALAMGRRVLFVSEKMAALNVVYKRLAKVGLGPFCLELHSNKARKRSVLEQLGAALAFEPEGCADAWPTLTAKLAEVRRALGAYVDVLHRPRSFGVSAHDGLCRLLASEGAPLVELDFGAPDALGADAVAAMQEAVAAMRAALGEISAPVTHPFRASRITEWTPALPTRVDEDARACEAAARRLDETSRAMAEILEVEPAAFSWRAIDDLHAVGSALAGGEPLPRALFTGPRFEDATTRIGAWLDVVDDHAAAHADVTADYHDGIYALPLPDLRRRLEKAMTSFWPLSWWRARKPLKALREVSKGESLAGKPTLIAQLDRAAHACARKAELETAGPDAAALLGDLWRGPDTDAARVRRILEVTGALRHKAARFAEGDPERLVALRDRWQALADAGEDMWAEGTRPQARLAALREAQVAYDGALAPLTQGLALDARLLFGVPEQPAFAERVAATAAGWAESVHTLRAWAAWRRARSLAEASRLSALAEAVDAGALDGATLAPALEHGLFTWWINALYEAEPLLRGFSRAEQEARVDRFRDLDTEVRDLSQTVVGERLATRLPRGATALSSSSTSELGVVARELKKQRRHLPIRTLFQRIPNLLPRLKPCMLMSPLSVAQYLAPDFPPFDLVVFDEASQIPTWDAVGAVARGHELIVVGDSKQLPPTTFFMKTEEDELQDEDDIEELESILDECLAVSMPSLRLGWHYRSRHESLIAFSNAHYYDGTLFTFPAAAYKAPHLGVSRVDVPEGVYEKGRSRANRKEAEAVVADIVRRLEDPEQQHRSIGVVTFSIAQQTLILDLLDEARGATPELDRFFNEGAVEEPVFVKNLENVQGDERDVILFSVCYGPDDQGRIAMNFGPLNRDGGERRLNVAITRAREQVLVFSTLKADDIDLARTQAVGVQHLKAFLAYAERGAETLDQALVQAGRGAAPTPIEGALADALEAEGLEVVRRVGCSGYRIDLGVADPEDPSRFLLGVETDGPMYATGPTARDRDRTRYGVLKSLGWHLERVWATDWWQEPGKQVKRIADRVALLRRAKPKPPQPEVPPPSVSEPETVTASDPQVAAALAAPPPDALPPGADLYRPWRPSGRAGKSENFHKRASDERIAGAVRDVLDAEAPIALDLLVRRVAERWSVDRVTERVTERVTTQLQQVPHRWIDVGDVTFIWREDQEPETHEGYRVAAPDAEPPREAEAVPLEEIANAAHAVLAGHVAMPPLDLARETARVFGYTRLGPNVQRQMEAGIERLLGTQRAARSDDRIVIA